MSLAVDGFWKAGFWSPTFWADGFWFEASITPTPVNTAPAQPLEYPISFMQRQRKQRKKQGQLLLLLG